MTVENAVRGADKQVSPSNISARDAMAACVRPNVIADPKQYESDIMAVATGRPAVAVTKAARLDRF